MSSDKSVGQWVGSIIGLVVGIYNPALGWAAGMAIGADVPGLIHDEERQDDEEQEA